MGNRVRIGTSFVDAMFLGCLTVGVAAAVGTLLTRVFAPNPTLQTVFLVVTGAALVVACVRGGVLAVGRKWLEPREVGFRLTTWQGSFDLSPADVISLDTEIALATENDPVAEYVRTVRMMVNHPRLRKPVRFAYRWPLSADDPLSELLDRLLNRLAAHTERELRQGAVLSGDGWALTQNSLTVRTPDGEVEYPRDAVTTELAGVGQTERAGGQSLLIDGRVLVWVAGEDEHRLALPLLSPNAELLHRLLTLHSPAVRPPPPDPTADRDYVEDDAHPGVVTTGDEHGLGRVLFSRGRPLTARQAKRTRTLILVLLPILILALLAVSIGLAVAGSLWASLPIGLFMLAGWRWTEMLLPLFALSRWPGLLRCHQLGLAKQTVDGVVRVRFAEVCVFTFAASVTTAGRWQSPTEVKLRFETADGRVIKHKVEFVGEDGDLDWLREHLGRLMATGMKRRLDAGEVVPWVDRVSFEPDGVSVAVSDARDDDLLIEWQDFRLVGTTPGRFGLFSRRAPKPVHEVDTSAPNFFPGFYLIQALRLPTELPEGPTGERP